MDDDPVLRSLAADLEQDDPALAAFLSGGRPPTRLNRRPRPATDRRPLTVPILAALALLTLLIALPVTVAVGVLAALLVIGSPLAVAWLIAEEPPRPRHP